MPTIGDLTTASSSAGSSSGAGAGSGGWRGRGRRQLRACGMLASCGRRNERRVAGVGLSDAELQPLPLQLELREVVLSHQLQNLLDVIELQSPSVGRQHYAPVAGDQHVIFDPHAANALDVCARLDGEDHARLEDQIGLPRQGLSNPRLLVHFETEAVPGAVPERLLQTISAECRPCRVVDGTRLDARANGRNGRRCASATAANKRRNSVPVSPS